MKLKQYIETLQELAENNPKALEYEVVYSKDDEGNGYSKVFYNPCVGNLKNGDFGREGKDNCVCVN